MLLPLTAARILRINLVTDGVPALALAFDRTPGVMQQPPRPAQAPLLDRPTKSSIVAACLPLTSRLLGEAGLPPALWALVSATATVSWACAEGVSRLVWRAR